MKKLTKEEFIKGCIEKHGDRYDYSLVDYINISSKITLVCKEHGEFIQIAKNHKDGQGCPICSGRIILDKSKYLEKFNTNKYDYSLIEEGILTNDQQLKIKDMDNGLVYIQSLKHHKSGKKPTKIESKSLVNKLEDIHDNQFSYIIESDHYYSTSKIKIINKLTKDETYYRVDRHLNGMKPNKVTLNYFLLKSKELHNDKYDYSLINKINKNSDKVKIICKEHGVFNQRVSNHMNLGDGCPKCVGVGKWNTELLISEFKKVHRDKFDYSKVIFKNIDKKVEINCKEHGPFKQNIHKHLNGQGCKLCEYTSKGEEYVKMWLDNFNINYIRQHKFETCRHINPLNFDFFLPKYNTCIEFDGEQHYKPVNKFGGIIEFNKQKIRDNVKNNWCFDNKVKLIRIKYNQVNKIKYILEEKLQLVDKKLIK